MPSDDSTTYPDIADAESADEGDRHQSKDTGFDEDAPGNYVDDEASPQVPEPNEPA